MTYATAQLVEEVAYVAYYFHWPLESILAMEHPLRRTFINAIGDINREINGHRHPMKWPFARHSHPLDGRPAGAAVRCLRPLNRVGPARPDGDTAESSRRRDGTGRRCHRCTWPAGDRSASPRRRGRSPRAWPAGQVLVRSARLEHVRPLDAPSGSFRGVLAPSQWMTMARPLICRKRRRCRLPSTASSPRCLASNARVTACRRSSSCSPSAKPRPRTTSPLRRNPIGPDRNRADEEPQDGGRARSGRRAGLADSRRRGSDPRITVRFPKRCVPSASAVAR